MNPSPLAQADLFDDADEALVSQKSTLAVAIHYATSRWAGLTLYVEDGRVEMDSNTVERSIRPLALTRKNALFAGSDRGDRHWAVIASLVETCKLNGVDPQAYLADVITRIVGGHPQRELDDLLTLGLPDHPGTQGRCLSRPARAERIVAALHHKADKRNVGSGLRLRGLRRPRKNPAPPKPVSLKMRRKMAGWDTTILTKILAVAPR